MKCRGGPKRQRRALRQCVRRQTRRAPRRAGRARCSSYTHLVAPFAGVVTARMADPGTMAAPGVPLLQVDQAAALQLQATVDESVIGAIHKGMKVASRNRWRIIDELSGDSCRDCSCGRSIESQLSRQDRPAILKPDARGHVWNSRVRQWHKAGDPHSALRCSRARLAQLCVCSRRPGNCATSLHHSGRGTGQSRRSTVGRFRRRKTR